MKLFTSLRLHKITCVYHYCSFLEILFTNLIDFDWYNIIPHFYITEQVKNIIDFSVDYSNNCFKLISYCKSNIVYKEDNVIEPNRIILFLTTFYNNFYKGCVLQVVKFLLSNIQFPFKCRYRRKRTSNDKGLHKFLALKGNDQDTFAYNSSVVYFYPYNILTLWIKKKEGIFVV